MVTAIGLTVFFDLAFTWLRKRQLFIPLAAIVTGLIISLTVSPQAAWYQIAAICALAMSSKNFIKVRGRHVFNPAATGLFLGGLIFNLPVSWWGTSAPVFLLWLPALISALRMRRLPSILSFLAVYSLGLSRIAGSAPMSLLTVLTDPTIVFFALVMLPEPMTSPSAPRRQAVYGGLVAIVSLLLTTLRIANFLPDILLPSLLLGNLSAGSFLRY